MLTHYYSQRSIIFCVSPLLWQCMMFKIMRFKGILIIVVILCCTSQLTLGAKWKIIHELTLPNYKREVLPPLLNLPTRLFELQKIIQYIKTFLCPALWSSIPAFFSCSMTTSWICHCSQLAHATHNPSAWGREKIEIGFAQQNRGIFAGGKVYRVNPVQYSSVVHEWDMKWIHNLNLLNLLQ